MISVIVAATWAVWAWSTGVYPAAMAVGWKTTMICARNSLAIVGGWAAEPMTEPLWKSVLETPLRLNPMLSPADASCMATWWVSIVLTSACRPSGMITTGSPTFILPVSTLPTGTVPTPVIVYTSWIGRRRGFSVGFGGSVNSSSAWSRVGPLYQGMFVEGLTSFSPVHPEMGMKRILLVLYPDAFNSASTSVFALLNMVSLYLTVWSSILLMATTSWLTPSVFSRNACSLAWPPAPSAVSFSPVLAETTITAASASEAPVIMFLMKSR